MDESDIEAFSKELAKLGKPLANLAKGGDSPPPNTESPARFRVQIYDIEVGKVTTSWPCTDYQVDVNEERTGVVLNTDMCRYVQDPSRKRVKRT